MYQRFENCIYNIGSPEPEGCDLTAANHPLALATAKRRYEIDGSGFKSAERYMRAFLLSRRKVGY